MQCYCCAVCTNLVTIHLFSHRQTLLFSATLPKVLVEFARAGQTNSLYSIASDGYSLSHNLLSSLYSMQG